MLTRHEKDTLNRGMLVGAHGTWGYDHHGDFHHHHHSNHNGNSMGSTGWTSNRRASIPWYAQSSDPSAGPATARDLGWGGATSHRPAKIDEDRVCWNLSGVIWFDRQCGKPRLTPLFMSEKRSVLFFGPLSHYMSLLPSKADGGDFFGHLNGNRSLRSGLQNHITGCHGNFEPGHGVWDTESTCQRRSLHPTSRMLRSFTKSKHPKFIKIP